jgi:three-Cys-motif partner protein
MATSDFFKKKQPWSKVKDRVVAGYLKPYCAKLLAMHKPLKIVDCFAGKGKFDDGEDGSPMMIARTIKEILKNSDSYDYKNIEACFIEKKYHKDLEKNLLYQSNCRVISGNFEDNIKQILEKNKNLGTNLFLYIDPYGIKSLSFEIFNSLKTMDNVSTEVLMNFNSFGFLREGFRLLKKDMPKELKVSNYEMDGKNSIERMNEIANGDYWQSIIEDKNSGKLTMFEAEQKFIKVYTNELKNTYKYVLHIPIKEKRKHLPKYRLIFGTNHHEGLFLMVDNMNKNWKQFLNDVQDKSLFDEFEFPDYEVLDLSIEDKILEILSDNKQIEFKILLIKLIDFFGISYSITDYITKLKILGGETSNQLGGLFAPPTKIKIIRNYKTSSGKVPKDLNWNNEIYIERK